MADYNYGAAERRPSKTKLLTITPKDIGGNYWFEADIEPLSEQQQMLRMQMIQAFRAAGPDGKPYMSDLDLRRTLGHDPHPQETQERAALQWLEANDPEIQQTAQASLRRRWKQLNAATVKEAEQELNPDPDKEFEKLKRTLTPEKLQQLIAGAAQAQALAAQGGPSVPEQMQMAQAAQAQQGEMDRRRALMPKSALPYREDGPSPEVSPTQARGMTQAPQPMAADPQTVATQYRRGRPQP